MRAVLAEEPAAVGAEVFDGDLRSRRAGRDQRGCHLLIHHHGDIGHQDIAVGVFLRHIRHDRRAVGQDDLALGVQLRGLNGDGNVGHDRLAFGVGFGDLRGKGLH